MAMLEGKRRQNKAYKAARRQRRPSWLTPVQRMVMNQMGLCCPPGHSVDHIVPLRGITVSGLHVPWNLQVIPKDQNSAKGSGWPTDRLWDISELQSLLGFQHKYLRIGAPRGCFTERRK